MNIETISELYQLISNGTQNIAPRNKFISLRKAGFDSFKSGFFKSAFKKNSFDTRRINQETEFNPRRGLQNYNRSEAFLSEAMGQKIIHLSKLKIALDDLKQEFGKEHEWQDSNARVLLSTLDQGLRTIQKDGDFSDGQPSQGSLDYIEELLHVRYRLTFNDLTKLAKSELKKIILSKDEELTRKDVNEALEITKKDIGSQSYDSLMDKLFNGVKADKNNRSVQRTVSITIKDEYLGED